MDKILTTPDLRVWCETPRILFFIIRANIVNERIEFFRKNDNIKWVNSYLLTSEKDHFRRYKQGELSSAKKKSYIHTGTDNIHIILYPWSIINKVLKSIKESDKYNKYTSSQQLALCLYFIEKDNHFTGDGIWNIMEQEKQLKDNEKMTLETDELRD
ncbi:hypothetical protein HZH66_011254 [Vespula vulgaris]|uniref:Uncharacterized protein n=1 Tax=Vespula vulgaris TaxID=7454 RepID=A0A834JGN0_VESVU|nr:hypothetical protein HZH66_011254 [Vespula vulgaris]